MSLNSMRRLYPEDWPLVEAVLDTRKTFQQSAMTDELHARLKENYVRNRIGRTDHVFFFGYFVDDELAAVSSLHTVSVVPDHYSVGISWTKRGVALPRWPGTEHYASALVELRNHVMTFLESRNFECLWVLGPKDTRWERLVEVDGCALADPARYRKEVYGYVSAGCRTGVQFIDAFVLTGGTLPQDQVLFRFWNLNHTVPEGTPVLCTPIPADAPAATPRTFIVDHPPRDMK